MQIYQHTYNHRSFIILNSTPASREHVYMCIYMSTDISTRIWIQRYQHMRIPQQVIRDIEFRNNILRKWKLNQDRIDYSDMKVQNCFRCMLTFIWLYIYIAYFCNIIGNLSLESNGSSTEIERIFWYQVVCVCVHVCVWMCVCAREHVCVS